MTRHARNNTASACYTYHERQRDAKSSGYGTLKARLGKDSVKDFDACCLTLQPCRHPVITPDGFLFDKESILEYIITKKADNVRKMKDFEKQKKGEESEAVEEAAAEDRAKTESFALSEKSILSSSASSASSSDIVRQPEASTSRVPGQLKRSAVGAGISVSNMSQGKDKSLPSFWVPSETPQFKKTKLEKPDNDVYCPMTGKPIKAKDLLPIKFTPIDKNATATSLISKKERYMCPVTHDLLSNSVSSAVLRTSGSVVTMECVEKLIKKDMIDPVNGKKLKEKDIIPLQRGGTGYSGTNQVTAEVKKPVMMA